ncbi:MAG TPA: hypothetical protein VKB93_18585 [Thermoanaerobaculia bacterium]|nr:hypothetical protein [Thermoanaerobaculia bacterium]
MDGRELFETNLGAVERIIAMVCRRAGLFGPDAEDFGSEVRLALIDNDYEVMRRWERRSSVDTFLAVVIQRLLADHRMRNKGRWHASSEAQRLGPAAVLLETLVRRDGRSLDEALPHMRAAHPEITREQMEALLDRLPARTGRPKAVDLDSISYAIAGGEAADVRVTAADKDRVASVAGTAVRDLLRAMPVEDRMLIRLRFASDMSIADISRMMRLPQRPLYRRLDSLLVRLRGALSDAGIDRDAAEGLVGRDDLKEMDFGLMNGKKDKSSQSMEES